MRYGLVAANIYVLVWVAEMCNEGSGNMEHFGSGSTVGLNDDLVVMVVNASCSGLSITQDINVAVEMVNRFPELLDEHVFSALIENIDIKDGSPLTHLINYLLDSKEIVTVLYPGCREDSEVVAEILAGKHFNLSVVTYGFPAIPLQPPLFNHYNMFPSEHHLVIGLTCLMETIGWKRIVILTQDIPSFRTISTSFENSFQSMAISIVSKIVDVEQLRSGELFPDDHRVFVLNMNQEYAREVLCNAYMSNRLYPGYIWITYGWYDLDWWEISVMNCSSEDIATVLAGALAISHYPVDIELYDHPFSTYSVSVYDAILAVAHALDHRSEQPLSLHNLSFNGTLNPVSFDDYGVREVENIIVFQYREEHTSSLSREVIGYIPVSSMSTNFSFINQEDEYSVWPNGAPSDGTPYTVENYQLLPLMIVCYIYASLGILFAVVCFIFNVVFRNRRLIRLTSPTLNYLIIAGAIVFYSSVYTFFFVPQTPKDLVVIVCNLRLWLTSLGYVLCYVPINVKMWRVFHICHKPRPSMKNMFMKDWHLVVIVLFFIALDVLLLLVVTAVNTSRYTLKVIPDKEHTGTSTDDYGITVSYTVSRCFSEKEPYFMSVLFGYKLLLQAIGVFLAFKVRKVKIKGLNDSKQVSAVLYITTILIGVVIIVIFVFGDYINVDGGSFGLGISTSTTVVLTFIFIPKMYGLYRDPQGKNIFSAPSPDRQNNNTATAKSQFGSSNGVMMDTGLNSGLVTKLQRRIDELESQLGEKSGVVLSSIDLDMEKESSVQSE